MMNMAAADELAGRGSILIVDDHAPNLLALEGILAPLGRRVVRAGSGEEALLRLLEEDFAVVLLDVQMPGMDGLETARLIKARPRNALTSIIFITAISRDREHVFRGFDAGAIDYLTKPFDPDLLRSKVSVLVDLHLARETVRRQAAELAAREREELQRRVERRFRGLIDSMPLAVWAARRDGSVSYANAVALEHDGRQGLVPAVHEDDRARVDAAWTALREGAGSFEVPFRLRGGEGGWRWHLGRAVAEVDDDGEQVGWIVTAVDIDAERAAREQAELASRAKEEFLATVSHELRTPLTAILGWTRLLQGGKLDAAAAARALDTVDRNARLQTRLIDDILDVSRIITGKLRVETTPLDLAPVVEAATLALRPAADAKGVTLELAPDRGARELRVRGDAARLQQVVWNLVSNAVKFTPRGGRVTVRLGVDREQAVLEVRDTGPGIRADFMPYLFDRFRQADSSSTRAHGGLGLGLAIVRHILELHGGTIRASSDGPDTGSVFVVRLPLTSEAPLARGPGRTQVAADALAGVRVLLVDDAEDARELIVMALESYGAHVTAVESAEDALVALARRETDVLISDIGLPGADGYALMQKVRALPPAEGGDIPAAALTAYVGAEDGRRALAAGYHRHIAKPVDPAELALTIAGLVTRS